MASASNPATCHRRSQPTYAVRLHVDAQWQSGGGLAKDMYSFLLECGDMSLCQIPRPKAKGGGRVGVERGCARYVDEIILIGMIL